MAAKKVIANKGKAISILILGDISAWWGANSKILYDTLRNKDVQNINLYISSDGGSLNEALVMYDMLKGHKAKVTAYLTGMVASAATVVACACDDVKISKQAVYMIHRSMTYAHGNANDMKKAASILEMFDNKLIEIYSQFATIRKKDLRKKLLWELIDNEYFTDQAGVMAIGLADQVIEHVEFDFDTEEMDWKFYSSGEQASDTEAETDPANLAKYGAYYSKVLQVKGYKFLSTNDIKNKLDMKGMKSVFASLVAFLGVQGFLKDGVMDDAKAAVENFNMGDDIENFIQAANAEALKQTTDIVNEIRDKFEGQLQELNTRIENVVNTNKELEAQNKDLRERFETDKNTVENFRKSVTDELAQVKNMKPVVLGNGEGVADPQEPIGDSMTDDERKFYVNAVNRGNITKEQYKEITGVEFK
jgi:ATP-dependent protease ClpP protease subunit/regulator of replication initiation timing